MVFIEIDGASVEVENRITVKKALERNGYKISRYPGENTLFAPCDTGGCWSCAVQINDEVKPCCNVLVEEGLRVRTSLPMDYVPKRIVSGFSGHPVGGVGTPWWLKSGGSYIEVACFASGCNFRCPQCQNWDITYHGRGKAYSPVEAAELMTASRKRFEVNRMAISGGESTLNRRWLVAYVQQVKRLNPDPEARIHIDTNGSILTRDYIDELVLAGMTDVGPDLKGYHLDSFMGITGVVEPELAAKYQNTAWEAVRYVTDKYKGRVFTGVGIPYNKKLISLEEIELMGSKLYEMDQEIQVCVLDYRPEFKRRDLSRPTYGEMVEVYKILKRTGLRTVVCQTERGHVGPEL
jgi:pyruvate formate lyase activating enzyme